MDTSINHFHYTHFKRISKLILESKTLDEEVSACRLLYKYFCEIIDIDNSIFKTETYEKGIVTTGGLALTSQHAFDCMQDPIRTVRFIKGIYQALSFKVNTSPPTKVNVLYAGCGPVAPLILPLLCFFKSTEVSVTLLDITEDSIETVKQVIKRIGASEYIKDIVLDDAITFKPEDNDLYDIVITETMDMALLREPQVAITQNLVKFLKRNGILIPEEINVYTEFSTISKEPNFNINKNVSIVSTTPKTYGQQHLFTINKSLGYSPFKFKSEAIEVPEISNEYPDFCVFAELVIYKNHLLEKSMSFITNTYCVYSLRNMKTKNFRLEYQSTDVPKWTLCQESN